MKSERKFYRTVIEVEVLSEEPYDETDLGEIVYDIYDGDCSGGHKDKVRNEEVDGPAMAKLLLAQGSDPEFFRLTEEGEDVEDEDDDLDDSDYAGGVAGQP